LVFRDTDTRSLDGLRQGAGINILTWRFRPTRRDGPKRV
jgi:hypothetical protein